MAGVLMGRRWFIREQKVAKDAKKRTKAVNHEILEIHERSAEKWSLWNQLCCRIAFTAQDKEASLVFVYFVLFVVGPLPV